MSQKNHKETTNYIEGRLGLIIDGTGKDFEKITRQARNLEALGYDTHMIFVNTSLDVALQRNAERPGKLRRTTRCSILE